MVVGQRMQPGLYSAQKILCNSDCSILCIGRLWQARLACGQLSTVRLSTSNLLALLSLPQAGHCACRGAVPQNLVPMHMCAHMVSWMCWPKR